MQRARPVLMRARAAAGRKHADRRRGATHTASSTQPHCAYPTVARTKITRSGATARRPATSPAMRTAVGTRGAHAISKAISEPAVAPRPAANRVRGSGPQCRALGPQGSDGAMPTNVYNGPSTQPSSNGIDKMKTGAKTEFRSQGHLRDSGGRLTGGATGSGRAASSDSSSHRMAEP
jgi:hypothetical protein